MDVELKALTGNVDVSKRESIVQRGSVKDNSNSTLDKRPNLIGKSSRSKEDKNSMGSKKGKKEGVASMQEMPNSRNGFFLPKSFLITAFEDHEKEFPSIPSIHPTSQKLSKYF